MNYRTLGRQGPKVSAVGFGAWAIGGNAHGNSYGPTDDGESVRAVQRALDLGCTFFDTADVYGWGHSEELLGRALEGRRDDVVIATKVGGDFYHGGVQLNFSPEYLRFAVRESLKRLATDHLDLYQLHNPPHPLGADPQTYEVLEDLRREGLIRHYGISIHDALEGLMAMDAAPIASVQVVYNLMTREPERKLLPEAAAKGVGVIAREPLWNGFLAGKYDGTETFPAGDIRSRWAPAYRRQRAQAVERLRYLELPNRTLAQAAITFAIDNPQVSTVIPGAKTVAQVEENMAAADQRLSADEKKRLEAVLSM